MSPHSPTNFRAVLPKPKSARNGASPTLLRSVSDWTDLCLRCAKPEPPTRVKDDVISLDQRESDIIPFKDRCITQTVSRT